MRKVVDMKERGRQFKWRGYTKIGIFLSHFDRGDSLYIYRIFLL